MSSAAVVIGALRVKLISYKFSKTGSFLFQDMPVASSTTNSQTSSYQGNKAVIGNRYNTG